MSEKEKYTRSLGRMETMVYMRTKVGLYRNFLITFKLNRALSPGLLFAALRKLFLEHPFLACQVSIKNDRAVYSINDYVRYEDVVETIDAALSNELLQRLEQTPSNMELKNKPLLKVVCLHDSEYVLVSDHLIMDGESGANFWKCFFENMVELEEQEPELGELLFNWVEDKDKLGKFSAPMDNWIKFSGENVPAYSLAAPEGMSQWAAASKSHMKQKVAIRMVYFDKDQTARILKQCKDHSVTFTPYLHVILMMSAAPWLKGTDDSQFFMTHVPISYRRHIAPKNFEEHDLLFGNIMWLGGPKRTPVSLVKKFSWDTVRKIHDDLRACVSDVRAIQNLNDPPLSCAKSSEVQMAGLGQPRVDSFRISNLGVTKFDPKKTSWECERMGFVQNPGVTGASLNCSVISTVSELALGLSFADDNSFIDIDAFIHDLKVNMLRSYP